jgi:hypothetical protein
MVNLLIWILIAIAVLVGVAFLAKWLIEEFIPEPAQKIFKFVIGVVLLILLIAAVAQLFGGSGPMLGPNPFQRG